jgi:hypothetical protein
VMPGATEGSSDSDLTVADTSAQQERAFERSSVIRSATLVASEGCVMSSTRTTNSFPPRRRRVYLAKGNQQEPWQLFEATRLLRNVRECH